MGNEIAGNYIPGSGAYPTYDEAAAAAGRAVTDATGASGDKTEAGTVVYLGSDGYRFLPPVDGVDGHVTEEQIAGMVEQANQLGEPEGLIHSHNDPAENGSILSPWDYKEGDEYGLKVEMYSRDTQTGAYCTSSWDPASGTGQGSCVDDGVDAISGDMPTEEIDEDFVNSLPLDSSYIPSGS